MKKKLAITIALALTLLTAVFVLPGCGGGTQQAPAEFVFQTGTNLKNEKYCYLTRYNGKSREVVIPDEHDGVPVTYVADYAFKTGGARIESVAFPDSVTEIWGGTFRYLPRLTSIIVSDDNPNYSTDDGNLYDKSGKTLIKYAQGKTAEEYSLNGNAAAEIERIGGLAFFGANSLRKVTVGEGVSSIGYAAFGSCENLEEITLPSSLSSTQSALTYGSKNRVKVRINSLSAWCGVTNAGTTGSLYGCDLYVGEELADDITIADVSKIADEAFGGCASITSVTIDGPSEIGVCAFRECPNLKTAAIGDSVKTVGAYAFGENPALERATIGAGTTDIGSGIFFGSSELKSVEVAEENANYRSIDGSLYDKDATRLLCYAGESTDCTVIDGVTAIDTYAFFMNGKVTGVTLPDSVTTIDNSAFYRCVALESVNFGSGVQTIGENAFGYCVSLKSVDLPASLTKIYQYAFEGCSSLETVTIAPGGLTELRQNTFEGCVSLKRFDIPYGVTALWWEVFKDCASMEEITIPATVVSLTQDDFAGCPDSMVIKCEMKNKPEKWSYAWSGYYQVIWDYKNAA